MADKQQLTDDLDLGPGLVVTPGHPVQPTPSTASGPQFSDRTIDHTGKPADHPILSTADGAKADEPKPATSTRSTADQSAT